MNRSNFSATAGELETPNMRAQNQTLSRFFGGSMPLRSCALWLCFLLGLVLHARGDTIIAGPNISGTWSTSGNRYIVANNCTIPAGQTLTIQPGVVVLIGSGLSITNNGLIQAVGTPSQRIAFQAPVSSQYWNAIVNNYGGGTNRFTYCDFQNANTALNLSEVGNYTPMVTEILNCTFNNCVSQAIYALSNIGIQNPVIENNSFNNTSNGCIIDAIGSYYFGCSYGYANPVVHGNVFQNLTGTAFLMDVNGCAGSSIASFINNTVVNCWGGVTAADPWDGLIQDNIFMGVTNAITDTGSLMRQASYNAFYGNATNFTGYNSVIYGEVITANRNGTPCDLVYNIYTNPLFVASNDFHLTTNSPCVNAGAPGAAFANLCFPPSIATNYPDLGAYGGPDACNWLTTVPELAAIGESISVSNNFFWLSWGAVPRSSYQILYSLAGPGSPTGPDSNDWQNLPNGQVLAAQYYNQLPVWPAPSTNSKAFFCIQSLGRTPGN
jgi:hypothetical protein